MTRYTPQWLQSGSYAASQDRRLLGALWPGPASAGCAVSTPVGTMNVNVAPGSVAVPSQNNTGSSLCTSDAIETVTLPAAPPSGTNRIDLIICRPRGTDLDGGGNNDFIFDSVQGSAVASPSVPATPAGTVALATVYLTGGSASIAAANINDVRPWGLSVGGAQALPPPVTTGATVQTFTDGGGNLWVAKAGVFGGAWRPARDVLQVAVHRSLAFTINGQQTLLMDVNDYNPFAIYGSPGQFTVPVAGLWRFDEVIAATATAANQWIQANLNVNGSLVFQTQGVTGGANWFACVCYGVRNCAVGDTIQTNMNSSTSLNGQNLLAITRASCQYLGTG